MNNPNQRTNPLKSKRRQSERSCRCRAHCCFPFLSLPLLMSLVIQANKDNRPVSFRYSVCHACMHELFLLFMPPFIQAASRCLPFFLPSRLCCIHKGRGTRPLPPRWLQRQRQFQFRCFHRETRTHAYIHSYIGSYIS